MSDDYSINYEDSEIETDPRFVRCKKDMVVVQAVFIISFIIAFALAYFLSPTDISEMKYFLGYPQWVVAATAVFLFDAVFAIVYTMKNRKFSFEARATDEEVNY